MNEDNPDAQGDDGRSPWTKSHHSEKRDIEAELIRRTSWLMQEVARLKKALQFAYDIADEELPNARVGTGTEVALRHIKRKTGEALRSAGIQIEGERSGAATLRGDIAKLEAHCERLGQGGAERYWEGRWRDTQAECDKLRETLSGMKCPRQLNAGTIAECTGRNECSCSVGATFVKIAASEK